MSSKKLLRFIHVGKCGGSTVEELLLISPLVSQKYESVVHSHVCGVTVDTSCDYLICLRNPIARAISAYEWRKKLVVMDPPPNHADRFCGEFNVISSYSSFAELACKLYKNDCSLDQLVSRDFELIHHLRESISFYLKPLLPILTSSNVYGIICQENLSADCEKLLGVTPNGLAVRKNYLRRESPGTLGSHAVKNLKRYLCDDYICLTSLWSAGLLTDNQFSSLMLGS